MAGSGRRRNHGDARLDACGRDPSASEGGIETHRLSSGLLRVVVKALSAEAGVHRIACVLPKILGRAHGTPVKALKLLVATLAGAPTLYRVIKP